MRGHITPCYPDWTATVFFIPCFSVVVTASKLQEKSSALKREHPALQKMKFMNDTNPGTGSGSTTLPCFLSLANPQAHHSTLDLRELTDCLFFVQCFLSSANPRAHHSTRDLCEPTDQLILCSVFPVLCGPASAPLYAGPVWANWLLIHCSVFPVLCGPAGAPLYAGPVWANWSTYSLFSVSCPLRTRERTTLRGTCVSWPARAAAPTAPACPLGTGRPPVSSQVTVVRTA